MIIAEICLGQVTIKCHSKNVQFYHRTKCHRRCTFWGSVRSGNADCRGGSQSCDLNVHYTTISSPRRHIWERINHPRNHRPSVTMSDVSCNYIYLLLHCSNGVSSASAFFLTSFRSCDWKCGNFLLCRMLIPDNWCRLSEFSSYSPKS